MLIVSNHKYLKNFYQKSFKKTFEKKLHKKLNYIQKMLKIYWT